MTATKAPKPRAAKKPATKPKAPARKAAPSDERPEELKNKGGRPRIPFGEDEHEQVRLLARVGTKQEIIATIMGCSVDTLQRRFAEELADGKESAHAMVAASLFTKAMAGDTGAIIWYEKTRCGFFETSRREVGGLDGKPIAFDLGGLTAEQAATLLPLLDQLISSAEDGNAAAGDAG